MSEERKYEPTPKRRLEAQRKGQFAYSSDLLSAAIFLFALIALNMTGAGIYSAIKEQMIDSFTFHPSDFHVPDSHALRLDCWSLLGHWLSLTLPFWIMTIASAVIFHFAQRRFLFAPDREIVTGNNVNLLEGLKRIFSVRNFWRTFMAIIKTLVLCLILYFFCREQLTSIVSFSQTSPLVSAEKMYALIWSLLWRLTVVLLALGILDYFWQYWTFERSIRMTEQQMRDEMKNN